MRAKFSRDPYRLQWMTSLSFHAHVTRRARPSPLKSVWFHVRVCCVVFFVFFPDRVPVLLCMSRSESIPLFPSVYRQTAARPQ